ncbi:MAG: alternate-type signal peptide domain-containing protein [Aeromicrobium sp.]
MKNESLNTVIDGPTQGSAKLRVGKTTKGAIAAAAAGVLLLGGAGTLAFWTDTATVNGTTINSGHFKLDSTACTAATWKLDGGATYTTQLLIPGDVLTKTCAVTVDVAGAHLLNADFAVTNPTESGSTALTDELSPTVDIQKGGSSLGTTAVPVADNDTLDVVITITWPYGVQDNDSNVAAGLSATISNLTVVGTQNHN